MEKITDRLLSWASLLEDNTLEQAKRTSRMPFIYPHLGLGATVGSVIPTLGAVMPAAVGVDIGCGMIAVRTQFTRADLARRGELSTLRQQIERAIPLSAGAINGRVVATAEPRIAELEALAVEAGFDPATYVKAWRMQLGSLGSGNHPHSARPSHRFAARRNRLAGAPPSRCRWTRRTRFGSSCTPAAVAWATRSLRRTSRSRRPRCSGCGSSCPTATWRTWSRAPSSSTGTSPNCGGRSDSRCSTARR